MNKKILFLTTLSLNIFLFLNKIQISSANLVLDKTTSSVLKIRGRDHLIEAGTQSGKNLFHSFKKFSLPEGRKATFVLNPKRPVKRVWVRVTGNEASSLNGTLAVNNTADLIFLNPSGISFGDKGRLNLNGSLLATTAQQANFKSGQSFSTKNLALPTLLRMRRPVGLQIGNQVNSINVLSGPESGNFKGGLSVPQNQNISLVGGGINVQSGKLFAPSGNINLIAAGPQQTIALNFDQPDLGFVISSALRFQNIQIDQRSRITSKNPPTSVSGNIALFGHDIAILNHSHLDAINFSDSQPGGNVTIVAQGNFNMIDPNDSRKLSTVITAQPASLAPGGDIVIQSDQLLISGRDALIRISQANQQARILRNKIGKPGKISIRFNKAFQLEERAKLQSFSFSKDTAGTIFVQSTSPTSRIDLETGATITSKTNGDGQAGDIVLSAGVIQIDGINPINNLRSQINSNTSGDGDGGAIQLSAEQVFITNGGLVTSDVLRAKNQGDGGNITVESAQIVLSQNGGISAKSNGIGKAGDLNLVAESLLLSQDSSLTGESSLTEGGNINLRIKDLIQLDQNSFINVSTGQDLSSVALSGTGGNIIHDSTLSEPSQAWLIAQQNQNVDISATSRTGTGGRIDFGENLALIGFQPIDAQFSVLRGNQSNDISAIGANPAQNGSIVADFSTDVSSSKRIQIPSLEHASVLNTCHAPYSNRMASTFRDLGHGGLQHSQELALSEQLWQDVRNVSLFSPQRRGHSKILRPRIMPDQLVEATGWSLSASGEILLNTGGGSQPKLALSQGCSSKRA